MTQSPAEPETAHSTPDKMVVQHRPLTVVSVANGANRTEIALHIDPRPVVSLKCV